MATLRDLAHVMSDLPGVTEGEHHGHQTWSVHGKGIAWVRPLTQTDLKRLGDLTPPTDPILAVHTQGLHEKEAILAAGIHGVFTIQHFNHYPAVLVEVGAIDRLALRDLLVDAWVRVAPPELVEGFEG